LSDWRRQQRGGGGPYQQTAIRSAALLLDYLNRKPAAFIPCSDLETARSNPGSAVKIKSNRKELKGPLQG